MNTNDPRGEMESRRGPSSGPAAAIAVGVWRGPSLRNVQNGPRNTPREGPESPTMTSPTVTRFDAVTLWLYWMTAALVLAQFGTALSLDHIDPDQINLVRSVHRSTELALWGSVAARLRPASSASEIS